MVDAYSLLNVDVSLIRVVAMSITRLLPDLQNIEERQPTRTHLHLPTTAELSLKGSVDAMPNVPLAPAGERRSILGGESIPSSFLDVICEWHRIRTDASGLLGYHYAITVLEDPVAIDHAQPINLLALQFSYNVEENKFFQEQERATEEIRLCSSKTKVWSHRGADSPKEENTPAQTETEAVVAKLPKFYAQFIAQAKRVCQYTEDFTLLDRIYAKVNYEEGVTTMRIRGRDFVCVREEEGEQKRLELIAGIDGYYNSDEPTTKEKEYLKENVFLINSTLKNKENMKKLIKSLTIPWEFMRLALVCMFVAIVCIGSIVTIYVLFDQLFDKLIEQIRMTFAQMSIYRSIAEAASLSLQMVSINE